MKWLNSEKQIGTKFTDCKFPDFSKSKYENSTKYIYSWYAIMLFDAKKNCQWFLTNYLTFLIIYLTVRAYM